MSEPTAEFVERGYNNRAACPDHPQWLARWAADSAAARGRLPAALDVRYGPDPKQTLDLFPAARPRAALLFIHGGYWRALDKADHSFVAPAFVERGIGVAVVNYDLCPEVTIVRIVEQCREAVAWLVREGASRGVPAQRLLLAGHSAGGHLVAALFATDWAAYGVPDGSIVGGVAISGVFDLEPLVRSTMNADLRLDVPTARGLSPVYYPSRVRAPLLLAVGARETSEFVRQTQLLWEQWPERRPPRASAPLQVEDRHHFSVLSDFADPGSELFRQSLDLA
jgi:arylformamidase